VDVVGPICESGDYQGLQRKLSGAGVGALLAVEGAGAYGFSMGSNYNSRPRPAEVMMDGEKFAIVRQREKTENLWKDELLEKDWVEVK
ncbi:MAG: diaminopimelate decarboxylase, partial [Gemmatimonadota bacterium]|nr:diaminopimelate decarboxylase [Gemmatimonadota bacterium]